MQMKLQLPVRFTGDKAEQHAYSTLPLEPTKTAFLLVDCTFDNPPESGVGQVLRKIIAPTLAAVRTVGMPVVFIYGGDHLLHSTVNTELHRTRRGRTGVPKPWAPTTPQWVPGVEPQPTDVVIEKNGQNAFRATSLDFCLRTMAIDTLLCVGFSFKSCLFYTLVGAFEHNYRAIFLRDGTHPFGENEFPDTVNSTLEEKGWVRLVLTRLIEDHIGYSSTCAELAAACLDMEHGVSI